MDHLEEALEDFVKWATQILLRLNKASRRRPNPANQKLRVDIQSLEAACAAYEAELADWDRVEEFAARGMPSLEMPELDVAAAVEGVRGRVEEAERKAKGLEETVAVQNAVREAAVRIVEGDLKKLESVNAEMAETLSTRLFEGFPAAGTRMSEIVKGFVKARPSANL